MSALDEKRFSALGKDWTARFDFNAICDLEDRTGRPFLEVVAPFMSGVSADANADPQAAIALASRLKMSDLRTILHASLLGAHPKLTLPETGEIIADAGIEVVSGIVAWAVAKAFGKGAQEGNGETVPSVKAA